MINNSLQTTFNSEVLTPGIRVIIFINYFGVFVFAITGALLACRKQMDIFGFVVLALMPSIVAALIVRSLGIILNLSLPVATLPDDTEKQ